jgi:tetratricopeptide (TPR) repeat protein
LIDQYAKSWGEAYLQSCDAAHRDGTQSLRALELRLTCLEEREIALKKLSEVLARGEREVLTRAVNALAQLEPVESCAHVTDLNALQPPPSDEPSRRQLHEARQQLAEALGLQLAGKFDDARRVTTTALKSVQTIGYAPIEAEALYRLGAIRKDEANWVDAEKSYGEAFDAAERGRADLIRASSAVELLEVVGHRETRIADGERLAHQAEVILTRVGNPPRAVAALMIARGLFRLTGGRLDEAELDLRRALDLRQRAVPPNDLLIGMALASVANVVYKKGHYAEADTLYRSAASRLSAADR